ncbi:hypothetical protein BX611_2077 [Lutibacter oceani]|uniref:Calx-beta domain-containing protein n=1 Tax=Lutibacter oceani TaxID=1853311 RepID=A0A3D9RUS0_9FLAO|nr:DUF1735 domain-containing protein [Lutibacter oceani]REE80435.1 hypothetical protein BX611_2077 [Lutibacter oceani]
MKKILKYITFMAAAVLATVSCNYDDTNFDLLHKDVDLNATYYVQFDNNTLDAQVGRDENGNPINVQSTILVTLMGLPQSQDITATISHNSASTMTSDMYSLSTTSVTIPAGKTSASFDFSTIGQNMPECESVNLILDLNAGDNVTSSDNGSKVNFNIRKISPSPLANGVSDLAGTWAIGESYTNGTYYDEASFGATWDGTKLVASGLGQAMIDLFWGEPVVAGGDFDMIVSEDGTVTIPRQYIYTTIYAGANYDYEIEGSGTWVSLCGEPPVMKIQYDIYYPGDAVGLAETYAGYFGASYFGGVFTLK